MAYLQRIIPVAVPHELGLVKRSVVLLEGLGVLVLASASNSEGDSST